MYKIRGTFWWSFSHVSKMFLVSSLCLLMKHLVPFYMWLVNFFESWCVNGYTTMQHSWISIDSRSIYLSLSSHLLEFQTCFWVSPLGTIIYIFECSFQVLFRLVPKSLGLLNLQSLSFTVSFRDSSSNDPMPSVQGRLMLSVRGPRLNNNMAEKNSVVYGQDKRLLIDVQPQMPKIKVRFKLKIRNMI